MPELFITSELAMEVKISWEKQKLMGDLNMVEFIPGKCQSLSIALSTSAKQNASKVMEGSPGFFASFEGYWCNVTGVNIWI